MAETIILPLEFVTILEPKTRILPLHIKKYPKY